MSSSAGTSSPRFQFSLRWLFLVTTLVAVLLGLAMIFGNAISQVAAGLLFVVFPTPLLVAIVYGRGDLRTFAMGAMIPWATLVGNGPPGNADWGDVIGLAIWLLFFWRDLWCDRGGDTPSD